MGDKLIAPLNKISREELQEIYPNVNIYENGWIKCSDKLPNDYIEVLYFAINDTGIKDFMVGYREHGNWVHSCLFYSTMILNNNLVNVTHWMPLPPEPKDDE